MSYEIGFKGPASTELTGLLHGIQWQLNRHGISAQVAADAADSKGAPASGVCPPGDACPGIPPHEHPDIPPHEHPDFVILIVVAAVSFTAGVIFDRLFLKPSAKL